MLIATFSRERGVTVIVGGGTDAITTRVRDVLPGAQVCETDLEWLIGPAATDEVAISSVLLRWLMATGLLSARDAGLRDSGRSSTVPFVPDRTDCIER